jgi:predicted RNA binding protein YcfA (HicA-like mRNA interferase family)
MSPKLPILSGEDLIRVLQKIGYVRVRQKGSHVRMRHLTDSIRLPVTVPLHREIAFGTLRRILRDSKVSAEELDSYLQ